MTVSTPPVLTRLKLDRLRARRDELRARYDAIERTSAADPAAAYCELAALRAGVETLHPEAAIAADAFGVDPDGRLTGRSLDVRGRLRVEIAAGRARAEYAWIFAELVRGWADAHRDPPREIGGEPVAGAAVEPDLAVLDGLVADAPAPWRALAEKLAAFDAEAAEPMSASRVRSVLTEIAGGPYRSEALRHEARRVSKDEELCAEYAGALTLMFDALDSWRWPEGGVPTRLCRAEQRLRRYLDEDLLDLLFLEEIADRWCGEVISPFPALSGQITAKDPLRAALDARAASTWSAFAISADWSSGSSHYVSSADVFDDRDAFAKLFGRVHERVHGLHALGGRPVHVVVADVAAFGPSLSHALVARLLEHAGMPPRWRALVARFLAVPTRTAEGVEVTALGIFPDHRLGMLLAEMVLAAIDLEVYRRSGVPPVRLVDDVVLVDDDPARIVRAWQALGETMAAFGLSLRPEKCGSATLFGGAHPEGLPAGRVALGLLLLREDGTWGYDEAGLDAAREATRVAVEAAPSALDAVAVFSRRLRETLRKLVPFALGAEHVRALGQRAAAFYEDLHGPGRSLHEGLRARIAQAIPGCDADAIPDAVFYWPRTAGGLGLFDAAAQLAPLHSSFRTQPRPRGTFSRPPKGEHRRAAEAWKEFLDTLDPVPRPRQPEYHLELGARIGDFVLRGKQIYGEEEDPDLSLHKLRHDLAFYWQWVIALRGRQLLDAFGTFRFIEAARVPLAALVELGWLGPGPS